MMNSIPTTYTVVTQKLEKPLKGTMINTTIAANVSSNAKVKL